MQRAASPSLASCSTKATSASAFLQLGASTLLPACGSPTIRNLPTCRPHIMWDQSRKLTPKTWAASKLRRGQMSLTFTVFQELEPLGSLPLVEKWLKTWSLSSIPPRAKEHQSLCKVYLFCMLFILYFTARCQLSVIESRHSC